MMDIPLEQLANVVGGGAWGAIKGVAGAVPGAVGSGPSSLMTMLDKPGQTLSAVGDMLGVKQNGPPGSNYTPAQMNSSGGITPGRFDPPGMADVSPPISQ